MQPGAHIGEPRNQRRKPTAHLTHRYTSQAHTQKASHRCSGRYIAYNPPPQHSSSRPVMWGACLQELQETKAERHILGSPTEAGPDHVTSIAPPGVGSAAPRNEAAGMPANSPRLCWRRSSIETIPPRDRSGCGEHGYPSPLPYPHSPAQVPLGSQPGAERPKLQRKPCRFPGPEQTCLLSVPFSSP